MLYIRLDDWFFCFYLRIPPVFRRFRRVLGDCLEEKYHKSEKNHKKPMRYNGLSSAKRREKVNPRKVYPRNRHEKFIHESTRIRHEKACPHILRIWAESLCTSDSSIPSAPLLLQSSVHERARIRHERFIHETGTKSSSTKQARKVHPRKHTNPTRKGLSAYLAPLSRVPLHLYSLCSYSPPSTKGRESGTKGLMTTEISTPY